MGVEGSAVVLPNLSTNAPWPIHSQFHREWVGKHHSHPATLNLPKNLSSRATNGSRGICGCFSSLNKRTNPKTIAITAL